ncbi:flagellar motor switch protein FliN [candidate division GN15 bacterium]|nr:flagellar motor switch protein FliN [candidate division GN15 bacterium]
MRRRKKSMPDEKDLDLSTGAESAENADQQPEAESSAEENAGTPESSPATIDDMEQPSPDDIADALGEIDGSIDDVDDGGQGDRDKVVNDDDVPEDEAEAAMLAMLEDLPEDEQKASPDDIDFGSADVSRAEFQQLQEPAGAKDPQNIDLLMDVDLPVSIELGRTKLSISDILALGPGSVVELNKLAGEPVDLMVNNKLVAKGEVVVVDENFGLRITQLMTAEERLKSLGRD